MKRHCIYLLAVTLSFGTLGLGALDTKAADKPAAANNGTQTNPDVMKVWDEGFDAMRAVHAARLAIFNGEPDQAMTMMQQATDKLNAAAKDESSVKDKSDLVAIDGSLALADTFVPSPQKAEHIAKANEHFKKGERNKGVEQLQLGEIEVSFSRVLLPLAATKKRLSHAVALAKDHKYYEANLALKAAEDGLTIDTVGLVDLPKAKGTKTNSSQNTTSSNAATTKEKKTAGSN